jgi:hypothetical protein
MDQESSHLPTLPNGLFLAASGVAVLLAKSLLLTPVPRFLLAGAAIVWGFYLLGRNPRNPTPGWTSVAAGAGLALFGGLVSALSGIAGVGLIAAGAVSMIAGLFHRRAS